MRILVDADACPVKDIIVRVAKKRGIPVTMLIDTSHILNDGYSEIITVDKAKDSVDFALIKRAKAGDIVVTQDYGVATMALTMKALALNQNGLIYSDKNIDSLLFERHMSQKIRRSGGRTSNPPKRSKENDEHFETALLKLLSLNS